MNFKEWLMTFKTSGTRRYDKTIYGSAINRIARALDFPPVYTCLDPVEFQRIDEAIRAHPEFQAFNSRGHRMYSSALSAYRRYLEYIDSHDLLLEDAAEIEARVPDATEREQLVRARIGQGSYRRNVLAHWDGRCAVTGYNNAQMLLASHIKPWRHSTDTERLDGENGLPLSPTLDRAFDQGLISFHPSTGRIIISSVFSGHEVLGITDDMSLWRKPSRAMHDYLEYHAEVVLLEATT